MSKILDSKITLGLGIASGLAGAVLILGGAFGHSFWFIAAGSAVDCGVIILAAFKARQLFHKKRQSQQAPLHKPPCTNFAQITSKKIAVDLGGNTYIPNPDDFEVIADVRIIQGHAQTPHPGDNENL